MRDLFETIPRDDPVSGGAPRRRPALRRRFYDNGRRSQDTADGYAVRLDGKPVRTPARRALAAPTLALAQAIAAEWEAQREVIDPATMPLTRLANAIIDGVADTPRPVAAEIEKYLALRSAVLSRQQSRNNCASARAAHWDPILAWARDTLGAHFKLGEGIIHVAQPEAALQPPQPRSRPIRGGSARPCR